jgi:beta-glucosidase
LSGNISAVDTSPFDQAAARVATGADPATEAAALVDLMDDAERAWCLDGDQPFWAGLTDLGVGGYHRRPFPAARVERLGVPGFRFADGPRGVVIGPATAFPVSMARGATWDVDLEERIGEAMGQELRAVGADLYGGVCVNVLRHPAWGRAQETYGEDPVLVGELGAALTRGVQRHAMACVKHFACNSMENARFIVDVTVDDAALHEVFLPHFRRIVEEGVAVVMSAYNAVNGEWCGQSRQLLTDVLRSEWGFEGIVISDWIFGLRDAGPSVRNGLDVEMPYRMIRAHGLDEALAAGECTPEEITATVTNVVALQLRFRSLLDRPAPGPEVLACADHRALAREAATESLVLLRNEPVDGKTVLPLDAATLERVAVVGRLAAVRNLGDGGSSDVWAPTAVTPLDGLRAALPDAEVEHLDGSDPEAAAALAERADVAVVVVGYTKADEGEFIGAGGTAHLNDLMPGPDDPELAAAFEAEVAAAGEPTEPPAGALAEGDSLGFAKGGDRSSLRLHAEDEALIRAVAAANPRTVVAIVAGSAVLVDGWSATVPALVQSWYAGMEGGHALADVLLGRAEPTGRLPFTVPTDPGHLPPFDAEATAVTYDGWHGYWKLAHDGHRALHPFGFGLSYTELAIDAATAELDGDAVVVTATAANRGDRSGMEVVQVYGGEPGAPSRLVGFARHPIAAGAAEAVEVRIPLDRFARRERGSWRAARSPLHLRVARHAEDPAAHQLSLDLPA